MSIGIISFLDILGWKGIYVRQQPIKNLKRLITDIENILEKERGIVNNDTIVKSISDTIVILTPCDNSEITKAIEIHGRLCQSIIPKSIGLGLPIRGATAYGEFENQDNIFVGKAVDEAASWHEQSNWIGVNLTPSADFVFEQKNGQSSWIKYPLPFKFSLKWDPYCVDWTNEWTDFETEIKEIKTKFLEMGPVLPEIAPKFINTLAFLEQQKKDHLNSRRDPNRISM